MSDIQRVMYLDVQLNDGAIPLVIDMSTNPQLELTFDATAGGRLPYYDGSYEVEPRKVAQTLETMNKSMSDNVVVNAIHYAETSNPYGDTVIIGYE